MVNLTFFDDEVSHGEHHGVSGEDVVAAVDVLPVDGEPHPGHQDQDPLHDHWGAGGHSSLEGGFVGTSLWKA